MSANFHTFLLGLFSNASLKGYLKHFVFLSEVLGFFQAAQNLIPSWFTGSLPDPTIDKITHLHYPGNGQMLPQPLKQLLSFLVKISQAPSSIPVVFEYGWNNHPSGNAADSRSCTVSVFLRILSYHMLCFYTERENPPCFSRLFSTF